MGRIRTIKPEFFTSEDIVTLEPLTRLLYQALWCEADREGRLVYKPLTFKIRYFPADDCNIVAMCDALLTRGLLVLYESAGVMYAYIPTFHAHQHINPREAASQLPEPPKEGRKSGSRASRVTDATTTREGRVPHAQGGKERKGKEGEEKTNRQLGSNCANEHSTPVPATRDSSLPSASNGKGKGKSIGEFAREDEDLSRVRAEQIARLKAGAA